jgi:hypothetical protein
MYISGIYITKTPGLVYPASNMSGSDLHHTHSATHTAAMLSRSHYEVPILVLEVGLDASLHFP